MEGTHESLAAVRSRNQHLGHQVLMVGDSKLISYANLAVMTADGVGFIAPASKVFAERLLVISPELADVLSTIICCVRDSSGAVPLVIS
ncbi:hypothetical protein [Nonomuraea sp. KM88]|uniref:hypothetical protein n=1 Tax=Nonomuraea sp. KM88 TaxID=3457427 RepID=UPI003FCCFC5F